MSISKTFIIFQLSRDGDVQAMEALLEEVGPPQSKRVIAKINTLDENKVGILHYAARYEQLPMVKLIVSWGGDVNIRGDDGLTPLHFAARYEWYAKEFTETFNFEPFIWNRFKIIRNSNSEYSLQQYPGKNVLNVSEPATLDIKEILGNAYTYLSYVLKTVKGESTTFVR